MYHKDIVPGRVTTIIKQPYYKTSSSCLFKILICLIISIGTLLYVVDITTIELLPVHLSLHFIGVGGGSSSGNGGNIGIIHDDGSSTYNWDKIRQQIESEWDKSYFVNTPGCKMPSFPVINEKINKFIDVPVSKVCDTIPSLTQTNSTNWLWISLNQTELNEYYGVEDMEQLKCEYREFHRKNDFSNIISSIEMANIIKYGEFIHINDEFIRVNCTYGLNNTNIYLNFHSFFLPSKFEIPIKKTKTENDGKIKKSSSSTTTSTKKESISNAIKSKKLNVMILGIDSVSRLNFHRQMHQTVDVILNKYKAIELFGYNKVNDNTYPNLIPVLTGLDSNELSATCENGTFDKCHFIWHNFKELNYRTAYGEDMAWMNLFNHAHRGFINQSTDFNNRPMMLEMEKYLKGKRMGNAYECLGNQRPVNILLDYITKFIQSMEQNNQSYFSFFWSISYTHDYLNYPQLIDQDIANFLKNLNKSMTNSGGDGTAERGDTTIENTFFIFMSDHGIRWGNFRNTYQGMMEERQPFLYLIPPKWFANKYPMAMQNLLINRRKLTTHFDLYETLRDLSDLPSIKSDQIKLRSQELLDIDPMPRGISLFLPVPLSRTCYMAAIATHWCTCHERQPISTKNSKVQRAARQIVSHINQMVKSYPQCQQLSLNRISDANVGISNKEIVEKHNDHFMDITVRLQTKPGYAEFESTVRLHDDGNLELTGTISRTNLFGKQSQCVDDYKVKLYCFCDSFL